MNQYLEVILNCDELSKTIIKFLIKDDTSDSQNNYKIEYEMTSCNFVKFTIVKKVKIGEFGGELKEELDINDLEQILRIVLNNDEFDFSGWNFILKDSKENPNKKEFNGVIIKLTPVQEEATFVNRLMLEE